MKGSDLVEFVDALRELLGLDPLPGVVCERTRQWREEERNPGLRVYVYERAMPVGRGRSW